MDIHAHRLLIVDFGGLPPGTVVRVVNLGPDEPFGGGVPGVVTTAKNSRNSRSSDHSPRLVCDPLLTRLKRPLLSSDSRTTTVTTSGR